MISSTLKGHQRGPVEASLREPRKRLPKAEYPLGPPAANLAEVTGAGFEKDRGGGEATAPVLTFTSEERSDERVERERMAAACAPSLGRAKSRAQRAMMHIADRLI